MEINLGNEKFYGWNWLTVMLVALCLCAYLVWDYTLTDFRCNELDAALWQKVEQYHRSLYHPRRDPFWGTLIYDQRELFEAHQR